MVEWIKQYAVPLIGGLTGLGIWLGLYLEQTGIVKNYFHHK